MNECLSLGEVDTDENLYNYTYRIQFNYVSFLRGLKFISGRIL
jgi:hypothetical protein